VRVTGVVEADDVLQFLFTPPAGADMTALRKLWFAKDAAFDQACRNRFAAAWQAACEGACDHWQATPRGALALVILFDQIPRSIFRGDPRSYASDSKALEVARRALKRGFDENLSPLEMLFLLLPFEHSEVLADQDQAVALANGLPPGDSFDRARQAALRHREIATRFGRFPHRNSVLGRISMPKELAFLQEPTRPFDGGQGPGALAMAKPVGKAREKA